jgi:hypothetical protein
MVSARDAKNKKLMNTKNRYAHENERGEQNFLRSSPKG